MKLRPAKLIKVIIFTLVCILFTVALGVKLANTRLFADNYLVAAEFEDATGVLVGDAVKLAGVDVGRVVKTEIRDGKALVSFTVDNKVDLPQDTIVGIRWRNVVGQRFIYLYPGDAQGKLADGDVIPVSQTQDVNDIGEFLNRLAPILQAIHPAQANAFLDAMNEALAGNEAQLRQLLDDGAELADELGNDDEDIDDLIVSSDRIMAAFAEQDEAIDRLLGDLNHLSGVLARHRGEVNSLVTNFARVQKQLDGLLKRNRGNIDTSIANLNRVAGILQNNRANLERTIDSLPMGVANYFQTSSWGEWFNVRVVEFTIQDSEGNVLVHAAEDRAARGGSETEGGGSEPGSADGGSGYPGGSGGSPAVANEPSDGVDSIVRFVTSGGGRG